jgi:hypothetical protein
MLESGQYISTLKQVNNLVLLFSTEFSNIMDILIHSPEKSSHELIEGFTKANSLTSLEFFICSSMKTLRNSLD